ncbi:MAG TPA: alpha-L-fucosidase [Polyangia bacterium]|nr:alpha-L-fucosidase [Polyangia bacterium]
MAQRRRRSILSACALLVGLAGAACEKTGPVLSGAPSPTPVPPIPSPAQLAWQTQELSAFLHFGLGTFTGKEIGDGTDSPSLFNPTALDARQWMTALRGAGFRQAMLTAKHHDGFCLWPTKCTSYSVAASPFRGGQGDVVREFVDAAREANVRVALALSPLDNHEPTYGTPAYAAVFQCQLTELLTSYGAVDEIWMWQQPSAPNLDWVAIHDLVHRLQPNALLEMANLPPTTANDVHAFFDSSPVADRSSVETPSDAPTARTWIPAETASSIRPSWFWHAAEDSQLKPPATLVTMYMNAVGRNSVMRLNVPPNTAGLLPDPDVAALGQFGADVAALYRANLAEGRPSTADSTFDGGPAYQAASAVDGNPTTYWAAAAGARSARLEVSLDGTRAFALISLQEPIALGERTTQYHVDARVNGAWTTVASGTAIGERKLFQVDPVTADAVALVITAARGAPAISELGLYQMASP